MSLLVGGGCGSVEKPAVADAAVDDAEVVDGDVEEDAAVSLACPAGCLPPAPEGWSGPAATYDGAENTKPTDCPAQYTELQVESHVGMTAAAATCACGAASVSGRRCEASVVTYSGNGCTGTAILEGKVTTASCISTTNGTQATYRVNAPTLIPGTCTFPNASTTKPAPAFEKVEMACGLAQVSACVSRPDCVATPTPAQPFGRMCIHTAGDVACPSEDYSMRFVAYKSIDDTRACSTCSATPTGGSCGTQWGNRGNTLQCNSFPPPSDKTAGSCYTYGGIGTVVDIAAMGPSSPTCTPSGGQPTGMAMSTEPVTFCCSN